MIVLDAVLPELLEGEHAANPHFMEHLLHDIRERSLSQQGLPIGSKAQQLGELEAVLVCYVSQGLQDTFISTLEACVGQDCGDCLVEELPTGVPAQLGNWFSLPTVKVTLWVTVPDLEWRIGVYNLKAGGHQGEEASPGGRGGVHSLPPLRPRSVADPGSEQWQ